MHFPLKKTKIFTKHRPYVKAVDGVTLNIIEGETFGLVGESGCGKSTLGRLILQLYTQTSGAIRYRGATLNDYAPKYAFKDAAKVAAVQGTYEEIIKNHRRQAHIAGGLLLSDNLAEVANALRANLAAVDKVNKFKRLLHLNELEHASYLESENLSVVEKRRFDRLKKRIEAEKSGLKKAEETRDSCDAALAAMREKCEGKKGFAELEEIRDVYITLSRLKKEEMRLLRRDLQIIFQDPYSSLNQRFSVGQLISEALVAHKMYARGTRQLEEYTLGVMDKCGLQNYFLHRYPHQFSGGQRQRIGIARALALQPKFVVCDEAVSALDVSIQSQIINLLMDLKESQNLTYLFISHDLSTVKFISDRIGVMYLGNIIELGDSANIFDEPLHPYTNVLLEAIPTTDEESKKELQVIEGDIPSPINPPPGCKFHTRCRFATELCKTDEPEWRELRPRHWVACHYPIEKHDSKKGSAPEPVVS
jgi:peptide/nickel transport system ATP-binding protein